jgi:hypothetical protein
MVIIFGFTIHIISRFSSDFIADGWQLLNNLKVINWWELKNCTDNSRCPIEIPGSPHPPQNLTLSGTIVEHPQLSWVKNTKLDMKGYNIYRSLSGGPLSLIN